MKIFVTGGAGFVGSNFVHHILSTSDAQTTVFDALTYAGNRANLLSLADNEKFNFVEGNVCDRWAVTQAMRDHDVVVHFAAESHVDRSIASSDEFVMTNCVGTNVVCDVARRLELDRVVHVSTDEVYGSISEGSSTEEDLLKPSSPYSASKAGSDLIALSYHVTYGLPVVVVRSANQFGRFQNCEKLIPLFTTNLLQGKTVPVYGDGLNVRNWLYVEDNCQGIDLIMSQGEAGEVYHLGGETEIDNLSLTKKLLDLTGRTQASIEYVADRLGHDVRYSVDSSKAKALGWHPKADFDTALESTVKWYRENEAWWMPLDQRQPRSS